MDKPCLNDSAQYPDDEVLRRCLGETKSIWDSFLAFIAENYPAFSAEWRYYRDGRSWLYKVTKRKKTVCWVSVYTGIFKVTFYFSDKAEDLITASKLKKVYVDQFVNGKRYGKIRAVRVDVRKPIDLKAISTLIEIKKQLK